MLPLSWSGYFCGLALASVHCQFVIVINLSFGTMFGSYFHKIKSPLLGLWVERFLCLTPDSSVAWKSRCFSSTNPSRRLLLSYAKYQHAATTLANNRSSSLSPVLMTHGLLGSKQNWNTIAKAVSRLTSRKVVTFDARNHGDSPKSNDMSYEVMAQDVLSLADHVGIHNFIFLGHSMGGRTAATTALKYSDRLSGAIIVDISPLNLGGDFEDMKLYLETMEGIKFEASWTLSVARKEADLRLQPVVKAPEIRAFLLTNLAKGPNPNDKIFWKPNLPILLKNLNEIKRFPDNLLNSSASIPCLFIRGQKSRYIPDSEFDGIRKLFPLAQFSTIRNAGHWPQADSPAEFIDTLVKFLKDVP